MLLEVSLILVKKTIQPGEKLLGAVVGMQDNWDAIGRSDCSDIEGACNTTGNRGLLLVIRNTLCQIMSEILIRPNEVHSLYLSCKVGSTTLGHLKDYGSLRIPGGLERSNNGR